MRQSIINLEPNSVDQGTGLKKTKQIVKKGKTINTEQAAFQNVLCQLFPNAKASLGEWKFSHTALVSKSKSMDTDKASVGKPNVSKISDQLSEVTEENSKPDIAELTTKQNKYFSKIWNGKGNDSTEKSSNAVLLGLSEKTETTPRKGGFIEHVSAALKKGIGLSDQLSQISDKNQSLSIDNKKGKTNTVQPQKMGVKSSSNETNHVKTQKILSEQIQNVKDVSVKNNENVSGIKIQNPAVNKMSKLDAEKTIEKSSEGERFVQQSDQVRIGYTKLDQSTQHDQSGNEENSAGKESYAKSVKGHFQTDDFKNLVSQQAIKSVSGNTGTVDHPKNEKPVSATLHESVLKQVVPSIQKMIREDRTKLTLTLHPKELGRLRIELISAKGFIEGKFFVESDEVKELMNNSMVHLRVALAKEGIAIEGFDVNLTSEQYASSNTGDKTHNTPHSGHESDLSFSEENDSDKPDRNGHKASRFFGYNTMEILA